MADVDDIPEMRTVDSYTVRNPDGTYTTEYFSAPIYYDDGGEVLVPIDVTPVPGVGVGAAYRTKAAAVTSELGASSSDRLLTVRSGAHRVTFRAVTDAVEGSRIASRTPTIDRGQVVYEDVYPGVDLRYTLLPLGAKEDIVLTEPNELNRFAFGLDAPGLAPVLREDGSLDLVAGKNVIFTMPAPFMVDSAPELDGDGARSMAVRYELSTVRGQSIVTVVADEAWLADPDRVYPVYIDPTTITNNNATSDTFISSAYPSYNLNAQWNPGEGGYYELWNGRYDATSGTNYAFVKTGFQSGVSVVSATFKVYVQHSYSLATPTSIQLGRLTSAFSESQTWNMTHPSYVALTSTTVADNQTASFNVTSTVRSWAEGTATNHGFRIYQSSTSQSLWKRIRARENADSNVPRLSITWTEPSAATVSPTGGAWRRTGALDWTFSNGGSSFSQTKFQAQISTSSSTWSGSALKVDSGQVSSSATAWTAPTTSLVDGTTYYWRVRVFDGHSWSNWTSGASFKWDDLPPAVPPSPQPLITIGSAVTSQDPNYYDLGNGTVTIALRGYDPHSGIKLGYLRLYNATDELRVNHDWTGTTTNCNEFDTSGLADVTACARTYNSGGSREVRFTVVGLNQNATFDIHYYFTDAAGNTVGYVDTGKNLVLDATAPTGAITAPAEGADVNGTVAIAGTASDANFKEYWVDVAPVGTTDWEDIGSNPRPTAVTNGTLASWNTAAIPDGDYVIRLRVYDKARTTSGFTTVTRNVSVDNASPPSAQISSPSASASVGGQVQISGTAQADSGFLDYTVEFGEGCSPSTWTEIQTATTPVTDGLLATWDSAGLDGPHALRLTVRRSPGPESTTATVCVTVDNTGPNGDFGTPDESTVSGHATTSYEVSWTESDAGSGVASRSLQRQSASLTGPAVCSTTWANVGSPSTGESPADASGLAEGTCYRWHLTLTDGLGNTSVTTSGVVIIDTSAPASPTVEATGVGVHRDGSTVYFRSGLAGTLELSSNGSDSQSGVEGSAFGPLSDPDGWTHTPGFQAGNPAIVELDWQSGAPDTTLEVEARNGAGVASDPVTVNLVGDATAPDVEVLAPVGELQNSAGTTIQVSWTESDGGSGVAGRTVQRERAAATEGECGTVWVANGVASEAPSPLEASGLLTGFCYRWVIEVRDAVGNESTATTGLVLLDSAPPSIAEVSGVGNGAHLTAPDTLYFDPATPGTVQLVVDPAEQPSGIAEVEFSGLTGTGWTTATQPFIDDEAPFEISLSWAAAAAAGSVEVVVRSGSGLASDAMVIELTPDADGPAASFTTPTASAPFIGPSLSVEWTESDSGSGILGRSLQRERAAASPSGCPSTGWAADGAPTSTESPRAESGLLDGTCYRWVLELTDGVGHAQSHVSVAVQVDASPPVTPDMSGGPRPDRGMDGIFQAGVNQTVFYREFQTHVLVTAVPAAGATNVGSVRFQNLTGTNFTPLVPLPFVDDEPPFELIINTVNGASGSIGAVAISHTGVESPARTLTLLRDSTAPSITNIAPATESATAAASTNISWTDADAGSGIIRRQLQQQRSAVEFSGSCTGVIWEDDGLPQDAVSPATIPTEDGYCYRWWVTITDRVGNVRSLPTGDVLVDRSPPTVSFSEPGSGITQYGSSSASVGWETSDAGSGVQSLQLRRERADLVGGSCSGWVDQGEVSTEHAQTMLEVDLDPRACYRWVATATDKAGNLGSTSSGVLALDEVVLSAPPAGAHVFDIETLTAEAASGLTIADVEYFVDGVSIGSGANDVDWDTSGTDDGPVALTLRAELTGGAVVTGSPVTVTVANAFGPERRVRADGATERIDVNEHARLMTYAVLAPGVLPTRYQGPHEETDSARVAMEFLADWDDLDQATQDEISAFLSQPFRGDAYYPLGHVDLGGDDPAYPSCDQLRVVPSLAPGAGGTVITYTACRAVSPHFDITFMIDGGDAVAKVDQIASDLTTGEMLAACPGGQPAQVTCNGIPDYVDTMIVALEEAYRVYVQEMLYPAPVQAGDHIAVSLTTFIPATGFVAPWNFPKQIAMKPDFVAPVYLARHELFHVIQYGYMDSFPRTNFAHNWWWMEATADWAAHQVEDRTVNPSETQEDVGRYSRRLAEYLGRPHLALEHCECLEDLDFAQNRQRNYGQFILAEYMEQLWGAEAIKRSWVETGTDHTAVQGITASAQANLSTLPDLLRRFTETAYRMTWLDSDGVLAPPGGAGTGLWHQRLTDHNVTGEFTGADAHGTARPARRVIELDDGETVSGSVNIDPGGFSYLVLDSSIDKFGRLIITGQQGAGSLIVTRVLEVNQYPNLCGQSYNLGGSDGVIEEFEVYINDGCTDHVVLALTHINPDVVAGEYRFTVQFTSGGITNGSVELGVERAGQLIVPWDVPSPVSNTGLLGMRHVATGYEALSHGCVCEGWGMADRLSGAGGYAGFGGLDGMTLDEFVLLGNLARSSVTLGGTLEVDHQFQPSSSNWLFEIEVTVTNVGDQTADLLYRRVIDWDIEPTTFSEYVTIGAPNDVLPPAVAFVSNDGFADPDPRAPRTDLGLTGLFDHGLPVTSDPDDRDHGALIDFEFGLVEPGQTKTFYLYYGAAPTLGDAMTALLGSVQVDLYSLAEADPEHPDHAPDAPVFMFGFKDGPLSED